MIFTDHRESEPQFHVSSERRINYALKPVSATDFFLSKCTCHFLPINSEIIVRKSQNWEIKMSQLLFVEEK